MNKRLLLIASLSCAFAQKLSAQVERYSIKEENGYGIVYNLPKTEYEITLTTLEKRFTPGALASWGEMFLGRKVETQEASSSEIIDVQIRAIGVPDTSRQYLIAFDKRFTAPFVALAPGNILYSINGSRLPEEHKPKPLPVYSTPDRVMPALPREYSLAINARKRAEIAANYLYEVREHAMNMVSGEVEQMPKDGESLKLVLDKLHAEEARTLRLFDGDTVMQAKRYTFRVIPEQNDLGRTLCYYSPVWGMVSDKDKAGEPITLNIKIVERPPTLDAKERTQREESGGIIYNIPGVAEVSLHYKGKVLGSERLPITQIGVIQSLAKKMINLKESGTTAIYFDLRSGALERVTTE